MTALDLETSLLEWLDEPNLDVVAGDVLEIDFPEGSFDLVHTRLVLMHIPERRRALERIVINATIPTSLGVTRRHSLTTREPQTRH